MSDEALPSPLNLPRRRLDKWRQQLREDLDKVCKEREELEGQAGVNTTAIRRGYEEGQGGYWEKYEHRHPGWERNIPENHRRHDLSALRAQYLAITDVELRRKLMDLEDQEHWVYVRFWDACIADAKQILDQHRYALDHPPWGRAAIYGAACVTAGYAIAGLPGAIGGAVAGLFVGQGTVSRAQAYAKEQIAIYEKERDRYQSARDKAADYAFRAEAELTASE